MGIKLNQKQKMSQRLVMTPQLQMAVNFLNLSRLELISKINEEVEKNPILECSEDILGTNSLDEHLSNIDNWPSSETSLNSYLDYCMRYPSSYRGLSDLINVDNDMDKSSINIPQKESISDYMHKQLILTSLKGNGKKIGSFIIGNLSKNGYLKLSVLEIAKQIGEKETLVKKVLKVLQSLDPAGICALNLEECLLIQAKRMRKKNKLVEEIISNNFMNLKNNKYGTISKMLGVKLQDIYSAVNIISSFDPKPGQRFDNEITEYIVPDIYIYENDGNYIIELNEADLPRLRLSSYYIRTIFDDNFDISTKKYIRDKVHSAIWIIKSINQRQRTIYKVMESIIRLQKDFFEKGSNYLKPMVLREVADNIGVHESTVSRATNNKYVSTYMGIFGLKYFFSNPVKCLTGGFLASTNVQNKIRSIIENENSLRPYSDRKISEFLRLKNIDIARRTVTKYRKEMGIMPSNMRKKSIFGYKLRDV